MREAVIVSTARTPLTKAHRGEFNITPGPTLGAHAVRHAVERLRAGHSVVVYPEGTRTPAEGLRPFQRGAAHIALRAGCDVVPVCITVTPRALMQGQGWTD